MDLDPSPSPRRWLWRIAAIFLALPLFYAISAGPSYALLNYGLTRHVRGMDRWLEAWSMIYYPLDFCTQSTPLQKPLASYVTWWGQAGEDFARSLK